MTIIFANNKLKKWANDFTSAQKKLGTSRFNKYRQRLEDMRDAENFNDIHFCQENFTSYQAIEKVNGLVI